MKADSKNSHFVIALYKPRRGKDRALAALIREHVPTLRKRKLATAFRPLVVRGSDGTYLEMFEWKSAKAVERAHVDPVVRVLWARFFELCELRTLKQLPEAKEMFPHFTLVSDGGRGR